MTTVFLVATVVGGTILVCQFALTLFGLGHDGAGMGDHIGGDFHGDTHIGGDFHADHPGAFPTDTNADASHPHGDSGRIFSVLSFRTLVAAMAFFGVSGEVALSAGYAPSTAFILALIVGGFAMYGMYWLLRTIASLNSSGNERIANAIGREAIVYISIPAERAGVGKVQLSMQNRIVEYQAVTDDPEPLKTGDTVEVVDVAGGDVVKVRRSQIPIQTEPTPVTVAAVQVTT